MLFTAEILEEETTADLRDIVLSSLDGRLVVAMPAPRRRYVFLGTELVVATSTLSIPEDSEETHRIALGRRRRWFSPFASWSTVVLVTRPLQLSVHPMREFELTLSTRPVRILALNGGGLRAINTSFALRYIELLCEKPLCELFDVIVGVSSGAMLAMGSSMRASGGGGGNQSRIEEAMASEIQAVPTYRLSTLRMLLGGNAIGPSLEARYGALIGSVRMRDLDAVAGFVAFDMTDMKPVLISRRSHPDHSVLRCVQASTAVTPLHAPFILDGHAMVDGGWVANNPSALALQLAREEFPHRRYSVLNVTTGTPFTPIDSDYALYGALSAMGKILDNLASMSVMAFNELMESQARTFPDLTYVRLDMTFPTSSHETLNTSPENAQRMLQDGADFMSEEGARLLRHYFSQSV